MATVRALLDDICKMEARLKEQQAERSKLNGHILLCREQLSAAEKKLTQQVQHYGKIALTIEGAGRVLIVTCTADGGLSQEDIALDPEIASEDNLVPRR